MSGHEQREHEQIEHEQRVPPKGTNILPIIYIIPNSLILLPVGRKRSRCGECDGCLQENDCGECVFCKDKPKFGGKGKKKKCCIRKKCEFQTNHSTQHVLPTMYNTLLGIVGVHITQLITTGVTLIGNNKGGPGQQIISPAEPQTCQPPQQRISARAFAQVRKRNACNLLL